MRGDGIVEVEAVDMVGAEHQQRFRVERRDLVADPEQPVGVALGEPFLVEGPRPFLRHQQAQSTAGPVEVPWTSVGDLLLQG